MVKFKKFDRKVRKTVESKGLSHMLENDFKNIDWKKLEYRIIDGKLEIRYDRMFETYFIG